jgi:hypothetical protein
MNTPKYDRLIALGFDKSSGGEGSLCVRCSQCEAMVIQGVPTHETGCPNAKHECKGCNAIVGRNVTYCPDCQ